MAKMKANVAVLSAGALAVVLASPGARAEGPAAKNYQTVKIAEGIYGFISPEPTTPLVNGNSVAVIGDDGVLVVDPGQFPSVARRVIGEIRQITDKPVRFVVNTHWHPDHWAANGEYRQAFPGVTIITTSYTRLMMETKAQQFVDPKAIESGLQGLREFLKAGRRPDGSPIAPDRKQFLTDELTDYEDFVGELKQVKLATPNLTFDQSATVHLGAREVRLMWLGRGNTGGDAVIYVPDAKVLMTGDLVVAPTPYAIGSFLGDWIATLDKLMALDAAVIVPGHGPVMHDWTYVRTEQKLLDTVLAQVRQAVSQGLSLEDTRKKVDLEAYRKQLCGDSSRRDIAFREFFSKPSVERAYDEAKLLSEEGLH
jgi:glyoxylase-like metal-dependent hydrolase (beta-lactamase superfamily II)